MKHLLCHQLRAYHCPQFPNIVHRMWRSLQHMYDDRQQLLEIHQSIHQLAEETLHRQCCHYQVSQNRRSPSNAHRTWLALRHTYANSRQRFGTHQSAHQLSVENINYLSHHSQAGQSCLGPSTLPLMWLSTTRTCMPPQSKSGKRHLSHPLSAESIHGQSHHSRAGPCLLCPSIAHQPTWSFERMYDRHHR